MLICVSLFNNEHNNLYTRFFIKIKDDEYNYVINSILNSKEGNTVTEIGNYRVLYEEVFESHLLLLTSIDSNILEDLELLYMLKSVFFSSDRHLDIAANFLTITMSIDEIIFNGYRQNVTMDEVENYILMQSLEEQRYNEERNAKISRAQANARAAEQSAALKQKFSTESDHTMITSIVQRNTPSDQPYKVEPIPSFQEDLYSVQAKVVNPTNVKGMSLTGKSSKDNVMKKFLEEEGINAQNIQASIGASVQDAKRTPAKTNEIPSDGIKIKITENIKAKVDNSGNTKEFSIRGDITCFTNSEETFLIKLDQSIYPSKKAYQVHFTDRSGDKSGTIKFNKATSKQQVMQWRALYPQVSELPFIISPWFSDENLTLEIKLLEKDGFNIQEMIVQFPSKASQTLQLKEPIDNVALKNNSDGVLVSIKNLGNSGVFTAEFIVGPNITEEELYPIDVFYTGNTLYSGIDVASVSTESGDACKFEVEKVSGTKNFFDTESYRVEFE